MTWHAISWGLEEVNLLWMVKVLLLSCQRKAPLSPHTLLPFTGDGMTKGLHGHICCTCWVHGRWKKTHKVKVPQGAKWTLPAGRSSLPASVDGCLGDPVEWVERWGLPGCAGRADEGRWTRIVPCRLPSSSQSLQRSSNRPQEPCCSPPSLALA